MADDVHYEEMTSNLNHVNKIKRRKALDCLNSLLDKGNTNLSLFLENYESSLVSRLSDESEVNRMKACDILSQLVKKELKSKSMLSYVIPTLYHQMGKTPVNETSEENRLKYLNLIGDIIDIYGTDAVAYINDISLILTQGLLDKHPDVVYQSCECILKLSILPQSKFPMYSNNFVKPLLKCLTVHRLRIRIRAMQTLESIFIHGDSQDFQSANSELTPYVRDVPQVRLALLHYGSALCLKFKERYSFWPLILPFVLFGLKDDDEEVRECAKSFWSQIGSQYEDENEEQRQTSILEDSSEELLPCNTDDQTPKLRFGRGCCSLIERSFHQMFQEIVPNMQDWKVEGRIQATRLLTLCIAGLQTNCVQYAHKILNMVVFGSGDQDGRVIKESFECAEYLGLYVPPDVYLPVLQPSLWEESDCSLRLLAVLVGNTPPPLLRRDSRYFLKILSFENVGQGLSPEAKESLVRIMRRLFAAHSVKTFEASFFFTLFYLLAQHDCPAEGKEEVGNGEDLLHLAARSVGHESSQSFVSSVLDQSLSQLKSTSSWGEDNDPELFIFLFLSKFEGFQSSLENVVDLLKIKLEESPPTVVFAVFQTLEGTLRRVHHNNDKELLLKWASFLLQELASRFFPSNRRRTGESLRLAAASSLNSILKHSGEASRQMLNAMQPCLAYVPSLINEDQVDTRILTCRFIHQFCNNYSAFIDDKCFFDFLKLLTERLDDKELRVRREASSGLASCCKAMSDERRNSMSARDLMIPASVFLADDDASTRDNVSVMLQTLGQSHPETLKENLASICHEDCDVIQRLSDVDIS